MKNKVFSFLLAIIMAFMPVFFAGCETDDFDDASFDEESGVSQPGQASFYKDFIDGFKVVYSNSQTGQNKDIDEISDDFYDKGILTGLNKYYGSGNGNGNLATFFPDSIRQTIYQDGNGNATLADGTKIVNDKWLWTLNPYEKTTLEDIKGFFIRNNYKTVSTTFKGSEYPQLSSYYSVPMQIVLYETLLGYTQNETDNRTIFEGKSEKIQLSETHAGFPQYLEQFEINVVSSQNSAINGLCIYRISYRYYLEESNKKSITLTNAELNSQVLETPAVVIDYLNALKEKYFSNATYIGLTKTDADAFITYILNNVIGAEAVKNDYQQFGPNSIFYNADLENANYVENGKNFYNYRNYIGRIATIVYDFVYDGSEEFVYTYNQNNINVEFDYVEYYTNLKGNSPAEDVGKTDEEGKEFNFTFRPQTVSFLRDYSTDMFFSNGDAFDMFGDGGSNSFSFDNSPMSEYQSIVLMPAKDITLGGIWMQIFSPNPELAITVYVRYYAYDKETGVGKLFTWEQDEINFYQSEPYDLAYSEKDCEYHKYVPGKGYLYKTIEKDNSGNLIEGYYADFEVGVSIEDVPSKFVEPYDRSDPDALGIDSIKLDKFANTEADPMLKADGETVSGIVEASLNKGYAYKVIPSKNGFGGVTVLDEKKVNFSFYEMVFDIKKDITNVSQNYDYKLCVVTPF